jgi:hypothetical protein
MKKITVVVHDTDAPTIMSLLVEHAVEITMEQHRGVAQQLSFDGVGGVPLDQLASSKFPHPPAQDLPTRTAIVGGMRPAPETPAPALNGGGSKPAKPRTRQVYDSTGRSSAERILTELHYHKRLTLQELKTRMITYGFGESTVYKPLQALIKEGKVVRREGADGTVYCEMADPQARAWADNAPNTPAPAPEAKE